MYPDMAYILKYFNVFISVLDTFYVFLFSYMFLWLKHAIQNMLQFSLANCTELLCKSETGRQDGGYSDKDLEWGSGLKLKQTVNPAVTYCTLSWTCS